jgi:hypothetical protein
MRRGVCIHSRIDMFGDSRSGYPQRAVCRVCPVAAECLAYAVDNQIGYGMWGGTTAADRAGLFDRLAKPGFVYVACYGDQLKIGWSQTPTKRVHDLQYVKGGRRYLMWHEVAPGTMRDETRLHREMAPWGTHGEWFWANEASAARALSLLADLRLTVAA